MPSTLTSPEDRADYIMIHFWDKMNPLDTLHCHDGEFMEINLVNYLSLFPHGSKQAREQSMGTLLGKTASDSTTFHLVTDIMERYLYDPNSPMRNEEYYISYLEALLRMPRLTEYERARPAYNLEMARKNRPGTIATDFAYIDRNGRRQRLHNTAAGRRLLLLFYDPACAHCSEILRQVSESDIIRGCIEDGTLTVLAIYTEGDRELWDETKATMPQNWIVGIDTDAIVDNELYAIPAMPVMYLLAPDKKVTLKDPPLPTIETQLTTQQ